MTTPEFFPSYNPHQLRRRSREHNVRGLALLESCLSETNQQLHDIPITLKAECPDTITPDQQAYYVQTARQHLTTQQRRALAEYVQNGSKKDVPSVAVVAYNERLAEYAAQREALYQREESQAEMIQPVEQLLKIGLGATAVELDKAWGGSPIAHALKAEHERIDELIAEANAEMAYYMGLAVPPRAVMSEDKIRSLWGDDEAEIQGDPYIDKYPEEGASHSGGSREGVPRATPEDILHGASQQLAELLAQQPGRSWTPQELGELLYPDGVSDETRADRVRSLLNNARIGRVAIISSALNQDDMVLQFGLRHYIGPDGEPRGRARRVCRAVYASEVQQTTTEELYGDDTSLTAWESVGVMPPNTATEDENDETMQTDSSHEGMNSIEMALAQPVPKTEETPAVVSTSVAEPDVHTELAADNASTVVVSERKKVALLPPERLEEIVSEADAYIQKLIALEYQPDRREIRVGSLPLAGGIQISTLLNEANRAGIINKKGKREETVRSIERALAVCLIASYKPGDGVEFRRPKYREQILAELRHRYEMSYAEAYGS